MRLADQQYYVVNNWGKVETFITLILKLFKLNKTFKGNLSYMSRDLFLAAIAALYLGSSLTHWLTVGATLGQSYTTQGKPQYYGILWYINVYYGILWYIMVYYGILRYFMVYYGILRYIMIYYGILWYIKVY